jgi:hypothetical protein
VALLALCLLCGKAFSYEKGSGIAFIVPLIVHSNRPPSYELYGSAKSSLLTLLALDNRLRYCQARGVRCLVVPVAGARASANTGSRISKLTVMQTAVKSCNKCRKFMYLDTDVVITDHAGSLHERIVSAIANTGKLMGLTRDTAYNLSNPNRTKYQTGVIYLQRSDNSTQLLDDWIDQYNLSKGKPTKEYRWRNGMGPTAVTVKDTALWESDQWLLDTLLQRKPAYNGILHELAPRHVYNAFPAYQQDFSSSTAQPPAPAKGRVSAAIENATAVLSSLWRDMRLPRGDEVPGESMLVHFAGARLACCTW